MLPPELPRNIAAEARRKNILEKADFFVDVQIWPIRSKMDPYNWLKNFQDGEMDHAINLLNSFVYYSSDLMSAMFLAAFQGLAKYAINLNHTTDNVSSDWQNFVAGLTITSVTKEKPSPTESGYHFLRMARQVLGISTENIRAQADALEYLRATRSQSVVFVDDFVGTGEQFLGTWYRKVKLPNGLWVSYNDLATKDAYQFFYCPLVCTESAFGRITNECSHINLSPAHILSSRYSALVPDSVIWPEALRPTAVDFLKHIGQRAKMPDTGGQAVDDWQGFGKLGLALAFEHSVPDATLPIFYWEKNNWIPLIRRT